MDTRDEDEKPTSRPQPHDQLGAPLQGEYGRILARMDQKLDQHGEQLARISEQGKNRDQQLKEVKQRQSDDAHKANNVAQQLSGRVETLQVTSDTANKRLEQVTVKVDDVGLRVGKLEAPIQEALIARDKRFAKYKKWGGWIAAMGAILWALGEPIWHAVVPVYLQRWLSGSPPP